MQLKVCPKSIAVSDLYLTKLDGLRPNALYLYGSPISHLPTNNLFGYARHYGAEPVALEWVDDKTCVFVFSSVSACQAAFAALRKLSDEETDIDDCLTAKPVPIVLWPAEDRINNTLGVGSGLRDTLRVRIARTTDKKMKGAKNRSHFYQKHGTNAGKDPNAHTIGRAQDRDVPKRQRFADDDSKRQQLDEELDDFLAAGDQDENSEPRPRSPPSKMRSDYLANDVRKPGVGDGRSLLERTSVMRLHPRARDDSQERLSGRTRRRRGQRGDGHGSDSENVRLKRAERTERPAKTREELDSELDAFLKGE